jgi:hypothetical protein
VDFFTPNRFGPRVLGIYPLEDWRLNILVNWRAGIWKTWTGGGDIPGIQYNVQWRDYWNIDLRFAKNFRIGRNNVEVFLDITNATNYRYMTSDQGFVDGEDYNNYMKSLHLPADIGDELNYGNIPGDDRPGMYRDYDVPYQPMENVNNTDGYVGSSGVIYYESSTGRYMEYVNGVWSQVDSGRLLQILDDKAYIDMPNQSFLAWLGPRSFFWGLRISFDILR